MGTTNIIINGSFDNGAANWNDNGAGNDIEASHTENTYQGNGSTDRVSEVNGSGGQITVMEQNFTIDAAQTTDITFEAAIRNNFRALVGGDGFNVTIRDSNGNIILNEDVLPTTITFTSYSFPVDFTASGDYTLTITEIDGDANSYGALIDDIAIMVVCLCRGTLISTPDGARAIETLEVGDMVLTQNGPKPLRWIGERHVGAEALGANEKLRPVKISAGAMGGGLPERDMHVSRQHRMQVNSPIAVRMFDAQQVLVSAVHLTSLPGFAVDHTIDNVTYFHLLFDAHQIIFANGAPTESLFTGPEALRAVSAEAREEILTLFPELAVQTHRVIPANPIPTGKQQRRLLARHAKNAKPLLR
ncbi:Hint domain-containing protein [Yoonia tamlensis]|uniref:Hint domain-containing protein n=1 Tax=Yoonia tamlensis TaxID=390270 RepID=A0A1I6G4C4_9RHOB|nr:Hint domain-containing protein [Yoonia tamlensis]SFR37058.1 Hint domain-containing protein [Yoonia tamlensis]